jgi:hypothetical protein
VHAGKTKYIFMSLHQNAGKYHNIMIDNKSFKNVTEFKYLGMIVTNQNFIHKEIKSRLTSGNSCYHSLHNSLSPCILPKNTKIKMQNCNFTCCSRWV